MGFSRASVAGGRPTRGSGGGRPDQLNLETLLEGLDQPSRHAFFGVLALEGFELTRGIPNLYLAEELDGAIEALADLGCREAWTRIHRLLVVAKVYGTLVDLDCGAMAGDSTNGDIYIGL